MTLHIFSFYGLLLATGLLLGCKAEAPLTPRAPVAEASYFTESLDLRSDRARYAPGETVTFTVDEVPGGTTVRYQHLGETLAEEPLSGPSWTWTPPSEDFRGYLVSLRQGETVLATVGIDVSSDWTKFPRYGFLSEFGAMTARERSDVLDELNRYRSNGLQFYDWHHKHHRPLPLDANGQPEATWVDIIQRPISFTTVEGYIEAAHARGMAAMQYNLLFGTWEDFAEDGVSDRWMIYNDRYHSFHNQHELSDPFLSNLLLTDPGNAAWQQYIFDQTATVYEHLAFDGWHLDQLGDRGTVYDYEGYVVDLPASFTDFLTQLDQRFPDRAMALNAVDQFAQAEILRAPVDFAYTEVWNRSQYKDLVDVILENNRLAAQPVNTVLAAYMQYDKPEGSFNRPAVLLTDAVIFAHGGAHLELGEHMLSSEYFPNDKLVMDDTLQAQLREYYDFLTAYENLLRDGGRFHAVPVEVEGLATNAWPPVHGQIAVVGKQFPERQVLHLLNFHGVSSFLWRDNEDAQTAPTARRDLQVSLAPERPVRKVWLASPDFDGGAAQELPFETTDDGIRFTLPYLGYWDMLVLEF